MKRICFLIVFCFGYFVHTIAQNCDPSSGCFGPNLITNGDFESFNPADPFASFSNDYPYNGVCVPNQNNCGGFLCQGEFAVEQTPFPCNPGFSSNIVDHTFANGTGNMMIVDFSNNQSTRIWCQTVNLNPNTEYCFGAWFINLLPSGTNSPPPVFRFEINGNVLGISNNIPETEQWQFEGFTFNSGAGGLAEFCIFNHNFGSIGFDLGIDDISLKAVQSGSPPSPQPDFVTVCNNNQPAVFDLLSNDLPGGAPLDFSTFSISSAPPFSSGTITNVDQAGGTVTFVPEGNFVVTTFSYEICDANGCCAVGEVQITKNPEIQTSWSAESATCINPQSGSISLSVSGGAPPFTFDWDNAPDVQNPAGLSAGNYTVTITDSGGCTLTVQATVDGPPAFGISILQENISCFGASDGRIEVITTGGISPFTFDWDNLPDLQTNEGVSPGSFNVTVTDSNGCTDTASVAIAEPPVLTTSALEDMPATCAGQNNGQATAIATGGTIPYSFEWSDGQTTPTATGLFSGGYLITVTDSNSCTETAAVSIGTGSDLNITVSGTDAICFGVNDGSASAIPANGMLPYTYHWSNGSDQADLSGLPPGIYFVTVTDAAGCSVTGSQSIGELMPLTADLMSTPEVCFGDNSGTASVSGLSGTAPFDFIWDSGQTGNTVSGLSAGVQYVTISDAGGCIKLDSAVVEGPPGPLSITLDSGDSSCFGVADGQISVLASGGVPVYTYQWANGAITDTLTGLQPGIYTVSVTDQFGCQVTATASLSQPQSLSFELSSMQVTCFGGMDGLIEVDTVLGGTAPYLYSLDGENFQLSDVFSGLMTGNYTFFVEDINGCKAEQALELTQPPEISVQLGEDIVVELGDSVQLDNSTAGIPGFSYQWTPDIYLSCADCPRPVVFPFESTTFQLLVTSPEGCTATDEINVEVDKTFDVFIPNAFSPNDDGWNDVFTIYGGKSVAVINKLVVFDRWGESVYEAQNFQPGDPLFGWDGMLNGRKLTPGVFVYYAEIIFLDGNVIPMKGDVTLIR